MTFVFRLTRVKAIVVLEYL